MNQAKNLIGSTFGSLLVIKRMGSDRRERALWLCQCQCGCEAYKTMLTASLIEGAYNGSINHSYVKGNRREGIRSRCRPEKVAYRAARARCLNPKAVNYKFYGGRGVEFRFGSFEEWFSELGPKPSSYHSVDRINRQGHYEKGNVRWATKEEQWKNQSCPCRNCTLPTGHGVVL